MWLKKFLCINKIFKSFSIERLPVNLSFLNKPLKNSTWFTSCELLTVMKILIYKWFSKVFRFIIDAFTYIFMTFLDEVDLKNVWTWKVLSYIALNEILKTEGRTVNFYFTSFKMLSLWILTSIKRNGVSQCTAMINLLFLGIFFFLKRKWRFFFCFWEKIY